MATGDTLGVFFPEANTPPDTNYATFDTMTGTGDTDGHVVSCLDFDDTTDEHADFKMVVPSHYTAAADFKIRLFWASGATTGDVIWNVAGKSITDDADDLDSKAFATAQAFAAATTASASGEVDVVELTVTNANLDAPAIGEVLFVRVTRDANNGSDTLSGDAELIAVEIQEA